MSCSVVKGERKVIARIIHSIEENAPVHRGVEKVNLLSAVSIGAVGKEEALALRAGANVDGVSVVEDASVRKLQFAANAAIGQDCKLRLRVVVVRRVAVGPGRGVSHLPAGGPIDGRVVVLEEIASIATCNIDIAQQVEIPVRTKVEDVGIIRPCVFLIVSNKDRNLFASGGDRSHGLVLEPEHGVRLGDPPDRHSNPPVGRKISPTRDRLAADIGASATRTATRAASGRAAAPDPSRRGSAEVRRRTVAAGARRTRACSAGRTLAGKDLAGRGWRLRRICIEPFPEDRFRFVVCEQSPPFGFLRLEDEEVPICLGVEYVFIDPKRAAKRCIDDVVTLSVLLKNRRIVVFAPVDDGRDDDLRALFALGGKQIEAGPF